MERAAKTSVRPAGRGSARPRAVALAAACLLAGMLAAGCASVAPPRDAGHAGVAGPSTAPAAPPAPPVPAVAAAAPVPEATAAAPVVETGLYRCELERRVTVRRTTTDRRGLVLAWQGRDHAMTSVPARSGALRYESPQAGLTWLVLADKSMLLDSRHGRQLANECRL